MSIITLGIGGGDSLTPFIITGLEVAAVPPPSTVQDVLKLDTMVNIIALDTQTDVLELDTTANVIKWRQ